MRALHVHQVPLRLPLIALPCDQLPLTRSCPGVRTDRHEVQLVLGGQTGQQNILGTTKQPHAQVQTLDSVQLYRTAIRSGRIHSFLGQRLHLQQSKPLLTQHATLNAILELIFIFASYHIGIVASILFFLYRSPDTDPVRPPSETIDYNSSARPIEI